MAMLIFSAKTNAQSFAFPAHETSQKVTASDLKTLGYLPYSFYVDGPAWGIVTTAFWGNETKIKSSQNFVKLYIDHSYPIKTTKYRYGISFSVEGFGPAGARTVFPADTLAISYNPDSLATYQDLVLSKYSGFHRLLIHINDIYDLDASPIVSVPPASLSKLNFTIEGSILTQWYNKKYSSTTYYGDDGAPSTNLVSSGSIVSASDYAEIKWNLPSVSLFDPVPIEPANFELEWTYVDNYKKNMATGVTTEIAASDLQYDFTNNATRVWLDKNHFNIPIIYQKGYVVYRVRLVRPDSNEYQFPIYSPWNAPDKGTISSLTVANNYLKIDNAHKNDSLNWQYTVSFAENGKYKHVLSYFDGLLKNRQSITRFNGAPDRLIATEQVYDYEGRPAISILPTPIPSTSFTYQPNLSLNANTGLPYQAADFDTIHKEICPGEVPPAPLHANALANRYYSSSNPDKAGFQKFVPDAGGYPFVQTIYSAGYDKRIDRQGGAGDTLQIGFGHDTYNDYVSADQRDLNSLFGIDVGWSGFYRKTVTTDPNTQTSMSVQDFKGRQVASAMIGRGPDATKYALVSNDNVPDSSFKKDELIGSNPQSIVGHKKILSRDFYMDAKGDDSIQYIFDFTPMYVCPNTYLSVKALYNYEIFDQCGVQKLYVEDEIGTTGVVTTPAVVSSAEPMRGVYLDKGKHSLRKELTINEEDAFAAVDSLMKDPPSCFNDEPYFIKKSVLEEKFPCPFEDDPCDILKKQMMAELWPDKKYGKYTRIDSVEGTDNSIFTIHCGFGAVPPPPPPLPTSSGPFADGEELVTPPIWCKYRYQLCTSLPASVSKFGRTYTDLSTINVDTFIYIFNDAIAEALLPLHPEYCKLLNCYDDDYKEKLESFPSAATAESYSLFAMDDIITNDPILPKLSGAPLFFTDARDSLAFYRGGKGGIDTIALMQAYCACSDSLMAAECFTKMFKTPITDFTFADPKVKENYYKAFLGSYFSNRERFKSYITAAADGSCNPCLEYRMTLIPDPVFPVTAFKADGSYDDAFLGTLSDITKRLISHTGGSMTVDSLYAYADSAKLKVDSVDLALTTIKIDTMIARFANCTPSANLSDLADTLLAMAARIPVHYGNFTPEQVRYAFVANGIALTDLCNPYIISYDYLESIQLPDNTACRTTTYYDAVKSFLNKESIQALVDATTTGTSSMFTYLSLDTYNPFEYDVKNILGSTSIKLYATRNADTSLYTVHIMRDLATPPDTFRLYFEINKKSPTRPICKNILAHSGTPILDTFTFTNIQCITENPATSMGSGYVVNLSFIADIQKKVSTTSNETCQLLAWNSGVKMTQPAMGLEECVPCTQMLSLYKQFADSMTAYGVKGIDHPLHPVMLRNFFNDKLRRVFDWNQYTRFIESCALADSLPLFRYNGYASITLHTDADATTFFNYINTTDAVYLDYFFRYKENDSVHLLLDFRSLPPNKLLSVRNHIAAYATTAQVNAQFNPTADPDFMGWIINQKAADTASIAGLRSVVTTMFDINSGEEIDVWIGRSYVKYYRFPITAKAAVSNTLIAAGISEINDYLRTNALPAYFINRRETTTDNEYNTTEKQAYLQRVYSFADKKPYQVLDNIKAASLEATIFPTRSPQYGSVSGIPDINNLYLAQVAHPGLAKANYMLDKAKIYFNALTTKATISPSYASFPTARKIEIINTTTEQLNLYYCSDKSYWYRYFGTGDTMFNVFFKMPKFIPDADLGGYVLTQILAEPGSGKSRALKIKLTKGADIIYINGFTDYTVGNSQILHDVLLTNAFGVEQPISDTILNCERAKINSAVRAGKEDYRLYLDSMKLALRKTFYDYVINHVGEKLYLGYMDQRFNYTLYYYDRAGNLMRTVPPAGVNKLPDASLDLVNEKRRDNLITPAVLPDHSKESVYEYNSLDKIVRQKTPDGGEVGYIYDKLGRVIFSQNEKQQAKEYYTYTFYDAQGRVTETGEVDFHCGAMVYLGYTGKDGYGTIDSFWMPCTYLWSKGSGGKYGIPPHYSTRNPYIHNPHGYTEQEREGYIRTRNRTDVVYTVYDTAHQNIGLITGVNEQENLRKRVTCIKYFEKIPPTDTFYKKHTYATHYSYDIAGNVKTLLHDYPTLAVQSQQYKTVDYDYDLASGKVNMLSYNRGWGDQYYQRYDYDDDNRITKVETSADGYIWKRDAEYQYYQHGPLARASIGDLRVQGIDFAYTIQGWLKVVNGDILSPANEMGQDSMTNNVHAYDAAATTLDYFKGDYKPIGTTVFAHTAERSQGLYNGNISRKSTDLLPFGPQMANYTYDQLNRIKYANYDSMSPIVSGVSSLFPTQAYHSRYNYDADGNITKLIRRAHKAIPDMIMDSMTYFYAKIGSPNKLLNITDSAENRYIDDVDKYLNDKDTRYRYDAIGNITKDLVSNQDTILWNLYNKVTRTENNTAKNKMRFVYDGAGHRVAKFYSGLNPDNTLDHERNEYFVHDAQGNILAVYKHNKKYTYESLKPMRDVIAEASLWMRTGLGTSTYINEVLANDFIADGEFEAALKPYLLQYGNSLPPKPMAIYLMLDKNLNELLIHNSADWVDSLRDFGFEMGNPMVLSSPMATAFVDKNYELSNYIMGTFMATPDTLKRRAVLAALPNTLGTDGMNILYNTLERLELGIDSTMDADTLAQSLVYGMKDPIRLAEALTASMIAATEQIDLLPYFDFLGDPGTGISSDAFYNKTLPLLTKTAVAEYGDRGFLQMFFEVWSPAYQRIVNLIGTETLYGIEYHANPPGFLNAMASSMGADVLDSIVAAMPDMSLETFKHRSYAKLGAGSKATLDALAEQKFNTLSTIQVLSAEDFNLAEHHLYGSSRLGIKNYLSGQVYGYRMRRVITGPSSVDFNRDTGTLVKRSAWYSQLLNELILKDEKVPYAHTDNTRYMLAHVLGLKQYEVTNHLGNVLSTISDNRYQKMLGDGTGPTADSIKVFAPAVTASYDYYPFGSLMPGRYLAADTVTELVDVLSQMKDVEIVYSGLAIGTGAVPKGGAMLTSIAADTLQILADTINAGMDYAVTTSPLQNTELQLDVAMLLGDPMRASVYELVTDSNQVLQQVELASSIVSIEGSYTLHFVPTGSTVYLSTRYHASGYEGTSSASAGDGGAGTPPTGTSGKGFSKMVISTKAGTEEAITRWRYVKVVKNPTDFYRFGFNGQEKNNDIYGRGTHLDFGARYYDSRLGRWFSPDPLAAKYPSQSQYNFVMNSPIAFKDADGRDAVVSIKGSTITITMTNYLFAADATTTKAYVKQYTNYYEAQKGNLSKVVNINGKDYTVDIIMKFKVGSKEDQRRIGMGAAFNRRTGENTMNISQSEGTPGAWGEHFNFYDEKGADGKVWRAADDSRASFHDIFHMLGFIDRYTDDKNTDGTRTESVDDPNWRDDVMSNEGLYDSDNFDPVEEHFEDIGSYILENLPEGGVYHIEKLGDLPESERTLPAPQATPENK